MTKSFDKFSFLQADVDRNHFAIQRDYESLKNSYLVGVYPDVPELSTSKLWDSHSEYSSVPDFRLRRLRMVESLVPHDAKILDIGVGWGEIIPMLMEKPDRHYTGVDFSLQIIMTNASKYPFNKFVHGNLTDINEMFSVIMALEVCEHVVPSEILGFFAQIKEKLLDGGIFILSVPLYENLKNMTLECPGCGAIHNRMGHVRSYTPELIKAELELAGFSVINYKYIYANFQNNLLDNIKRGIVNLGMKIFNLGVTKPLNIIVVSKLR